MKSKITLILVCLLLLQMFVVSAIIRKTGSQGDYFLMNAFKLEIDGVVVAGFKEVSGLESETSIYGKPTKIVLKRGFINDPALKEWFEGVLKECGEGKESEFETLRKSLRGYTITCPPKNNRKSGSIIVLDRKSNETLRYNFIEAWPTKWRAPALNSKGDTHLIEELELIVDKLEKA